MPYSNRRSPFGRRSGTVTVIEAPVQRNAARNAKIAAIVTTLVVGLLTATVAASRWHPIIAMFTGVLTGVAAGFVVAVAVLTWPVIRVIWWWSIEIITVLVLVAGWVELAQHTTLPARIGAVALLFGVPALIPPVRRTIIAAAWCVITRHRLRTCFAEFIITNRTGSLPLLLWTRPTPAGVRIWVWLRPGLALDDIQERLDLIAVACWATSATAEAASTTNAAHIRLDIKRRDALTPTVTSPLLGLVTATPGTDTTRDPLPVPTDLDLPDVKAADVTPAKAARKEPKAPAPAPAFTPAPITTPAGEDVEDYI
jgi:hypothetical protein